MAVEFTCSDQWGMVVDPIGPGGWSQCVEHLQSGLMVPLFGEGQVYVQYFMGTTCSVRAASLLACIDPCLCGLSCWQCRVW